MSIDNNINSLSLDEILPLIVEQTQKGLKISFCPHGTSMLPFIRGGVDKVVLCKTVFPLKKHDIALYKRANGQFVLHRVIKALNDKTYIFRGDHQFELERGISDEQIIATVCGIYRDNKYISSDSFTYRLWAVLGPRYFRIKYKFFNLLKHIKNIDKESNND